jgi:hypothetical protein
LFDGDSPICKTCERKRQQRGGSQRTAFNGIIAEIDLPTDEGDCDLDTYMENNAEKIKQVLQEAIEKHT